MSLKNLSLCGFPSGVTVALEQPLRGSTGSTWLAARPSVGRKGMGLAEEGYRVMFVLALHLELNKGGISGDPW